MGVKSVGQLYEPAFADNWIPTDLYSLASWVNGLAFRNIQFSNEGIPVIKIAEIKNGVLAQTKFTQQIFDGSVHLQKGDMLFSWSGNPDTSIDVFWFELCEGWLNQHIFKVTPSSRIDKVFLFYLLKYLKPNFAEIARNKQTTGLGHVTINDLKNLEVRIPIQSTQQAIANCLSLFDSKINLNHQMNKTLEAIGQAVLKRWFVDFEFPNENGKPYKSSGGKMMDSALGEIPEGWTIGCFGDIAYNLRNVVSPGSVESETPYIGLEHMPRKSIALGDWGYAKDVDSNKFSFSQGNILFGKLRPYFHKVGVAPVDGVCSTDILVIGTRQPEAYGLVLFHASSAEVVNYADMTSTGTKMPRANWNDLSQYKITIPPREIMETFTNIISPMVMMIIGNIHHSRTLGSMRDSLLPKLMLGRIRVPVEKEKVEAH